MLVGSLSSQEIDFFRRTGYLKAPINIDRTLISRALRIIRSNVKRKIEPLRKDEKGKVHRLDQIFHRHEVYKAILASSDLLDCLESLLGPNIELVLNRHNHATLNHQNASPVRLHRDILQWSRSVVTAIFFLEDSTMENGCTMLLPTSQFLPFVGKPNNGGTWMDEHSIYNDLVGQALPCPMEKGSVLLFDSLAFHTVGHNRTDRTRISLTAAYHSIDELDERESSKNKILLRGKRIYRGNEVY